MGELLKWGRVIDLFWSVVRVPGFGLIRGRRLRIGPASEPAGVRGAEELARISGTSMRHALLFGVGSVGDVFPLIAMGRGLHARGWRVTVCANPVFESFVHRAGLLFRGLGTVENYERITRNPDLWHPRKGTKTILVDGQAQELIRQQREVTREFARGLGERVVAASPLGIGARIAQEELGVPLVTVHLAPIFLRCQQHPPKLPEGWLPNTMLRLVPRFTYKLVDRITDPWIGPIVEPLRSESGLPPVKRYLEGWWNSPDRVLLCFPEWFGPMPERPGQARHIGFLQHDDSQQGHELDPLWEFMTGEAPPVVATFGSAMCHARWLFERLVCATGDLGRRLVILSKNAEQVPYPLPGHVRRVPWAPMGELLPRAGALIHHGGVGTLARALAAGVPQLVIPFAHDQHDNARRVDWLGCGMEVAPRWASRRRLTRCLASLTENPVIRQKAGTLSRWVQPHQAVAKACDWMEDTAGRRSVGQSGAPGAAYA